jgi:hypothetical protein
MAKRTVTKTLPDGTTVSKTSGCFGSTIAVLFAISLLIWAVVGPAEEYSPAEASLVYFGMALVIGLIIWAVVRYQRKVKAQQPPAVNGVAGNTAGASHPQPTTAAVAESQFQFVNYSGGLPSHPHPETKGTLILPGSGSTFGRWELHWATGSDLTTQHPFIHGGLARYPLAVEAVGASSSRVTISDAQNPAIRGHLELPNTVAGALKRALLARAGVVRAAQTALTVVHNQTPRSSRLGIADELAKLADLRDKGVMSDAEFASEKAKLLSE